MASAEQIKALLKSHIEGDNSHFFSVAMQVAAHEAKLGHGKLARELRAIIDEAKKKRYAVPSLKPVPIAQPHGELSTLLEASYPKLRLSDMVLNSDIQERLTRLIIEQRQITKIRAHGLSPRKKLPPKHDNYLLRIGKGERLYKFYYFRPMAGRREHFEYRILTKEKTNGTFEMVSYNFKIVSGVPSGLLGMACGWTKDRLKLSMTLWPGYYEVRHRLSVYILGLKCGYQLKRCFCHI